MTQDAIQDQNTVHALLIHSGTAGTAETIRATGQANGAQNIHVTGGTVVSSASLELNSGTITTIQNGTQQTLGTVGVLNAGSVVVTNGTVVASAGSIVQTAGTLTTGSLTDVATLGTILNLNKGTITRIEGGSVVVTIGTVNVNTGTIVQASGTLTTGSLTNLATVGTILNVDKGTITRVEGGSMVQTAGTVTLLEAGTITAGTVRQQWQPVNQVTSFGTRATAAGSAFGTISAASGAGTKHIVSGISIVVESGTTDVRVLYGTEIIGGSVLAAGKFVPSAGIARDFSPSVESGANSEITYHFVGAGTAYI